MFVRKNINETNEFELATLFPLYNFKQILLFLRKNINETSWLYSFPLNNFEENTSVLKFISSNEFNFIHYDE